MSWWQAKYKNNQGEYEITFASKDYEKAKVVEKICQAIIDQRIKTRDDLPPSLIAKDANVLTNGDSFRALTDDQLVDLFFSLYRSTMELDGGDIAQLWCVGKKGCIDRDGNIECDEERNRACILHWLKQPKEASHET